MRDLKSLLDVFNKFNVILTKKQKQKVVVVLFVMLIGAVFETIGVSIIIPFVQSLMNAQQLFANRYIAAITGIMNINSTEGLIVLMSFAVIVIYIIKNSYLLFSMNFQLRFENTFQKDLSVYMMKEYLKRPYSYFRNVHSTEVYRGFNGDTQGVYRMLSSIMKLATEFITVIAIGTFIFITDWIMALGVLCVAGVCFIIITKSFQYKTRELGEKSRISLAKKDQYAYQTVYGIKDIMVMRREKYFCDDYEKAYEKQTKYDIKYNFIAACPEKIIEATCISGLIAVVCIRMLSGVDAVSFVPKLSAFAVAAFRILPSVGRMSTAMSGVVYNVASLNATYNNLMEINDYKKKQEEYVSGHLNPNNKDESFEKGFQDCIEIKNINWKYEDATENVIENLSLKINKGDSIAFIGQSGAGKSTLADIILGLFKPQSGQVLVDGVDIFTIKEQWCRLIGYVPQSIYIIDDSIRNNITFGLPADQVSDEEVWRALGEAQLKELVEKLPEGLDTRLGESGVKLSGGQRQRIAIARALYYNPSIIIMDEATAALDNETEKAVMESIDALQGQKTLILIAHRLTTVKNCQKIYEIGNKVATEKKKEDIFGIDKG